MDHRAASLLTYSAWVSSGKRFPLYYMEAELGQQTQNFFPTHYVDITPVAERKHQAWLADTLWYDLIYPLHDLMAQMRGWSMDASLRKLSTTTHKSCSAGTAVTNNRGTLARRW